MVKRGKTAEAFGAPLAICINDCEIDRGQPFAELQKVCFRLQCAFAEMRWGNEDHASLEPVAYTAQKYYQIEAIED